ncbi:unnamed protein product, partial [Didymodactylos carnosus]
MSMNSICSAATACSVKLYITNSYRYPGQVLSGQVVAAAGNSNHKIGHAIDINVQYNGNSICNSKCLAATSSLPSSVQCFISKIRSTSGLRYGGDITPIDVVHIDDNFNNNSPAQYQQLYTQIATNCGNGSAPTTTRAAITAKPPVTQRPPQTQKSSSGSGSGRGSQTKPSNSGSGTTGTPKYDGDSTTTPGDDDGDTTTSPSYDEYDTDTPSTDSDYDPTD